MRSQTIHNIVKCRSTHSEVVTEFPLIFSDSPIKSTFSAFKCPCCYYRMLPKIPFLSALDVVSSGDEANTTDKTSNSTWEPCLLLCINHEIERLAGADTDFVGVCVCVCVCVYTRPGLYLWQHRYRRRHRHRFCRRVYARSYHYEVANNPLFFERVQFVHVNSNNKI